MGSGKTSLMNLLPNFMYTIQRYQVKNTREIAVEFHNDRFETIQKYGLRPKPICLVDLGVEQIIKHLGNENNTICETLLYRKDLFVN